MPRGLGYFVVAVDADHGLLRRLPGPELCEPRLELRDAALEALDDVPLRVRRPQHGIVARVGEGHDMPRHADDCRVWRDVRDDDRPGADLSVLTDRHVADYFRARPDHDVRLQCRVPLSSPRARPTQGHALKEVDVVLDDRRLADNDAHPVVDEKPLADIGAWMDLDACKRSPEVRH